MTPPTTDHDTVHVGVLLAGGESRRMGLDKRGLRLGGDTLLQRNLTFLGDIFPVVCLSVRSAEQAPPDLPAGVVVIPDEVTGSPLAGLASVIGHLGEPVFAMAADLVAPDPGAVGRVLDAYRDTDVALPVADDHLEPLHAVYGPGCLPHMRQLLAAGAHSILDLFPLVRVARVPFADPAPFFNVNTPADWAEAQRRLGVGPSSGAGGAGAAGAWRRDARGPRCRRPAEQRQDDPHRAAHPAVHPPRAPRRRRQAGGALRHRRAGQGLVAALPAGPRAYTVASASKLAFVAQRDGEASLDEIVTRYFGDYDVVICEGYRREAPDVVEIFRSGAGYESPVCGPAEALALVTDTELAHTHRFGLGEAEALGLFLVARLGLAARA